MPARALGSDVSQERPGTVAWQVAAWVARDVRGGCQRTGPHIDIVG
jgi:hypothetical protein